MITSYEDMTALARPFTTDRKLVERLIAEAEREDIRPRIGDALFIRLLQYVPNAVKLTAGENSVALRLDSDGNIRKVSTDSTESLDSMELLLSGCFWTDGCGNQRIHYGLRMAVSYFAYARVIRDGNIQATRYGAVVKDGDHSSRTDAEERRRQYAEVFAQAEGYLSDTLAFIAGNQDRYPEYQCRNTVKANRNRIRIIGD